MSAYKFKMLMDTHDWDSIDIEIKILAEVGCEVMPLQFSNNEEFIDAIRDADALLPRYVNITRAHIEDMQKCKIISRSGIGVDIVDVDAATQHGIWVTNVPSYCENEVADHAVALILTCVRKIPQYQQAVKFGVWKWQTGRCIIRMNNATFGLIGFGKIGKLIWQRLRSFGCRGLIFDPFVPDEVISQEGAQATSLDILLQESDIVHIQCPLNSQTHHLINTDKLQKMKPTAILTNASRGPIIEEKALYRALNEDWIAMAGLDDLEEEPAKIRDWKPANPLFRLPNVVITPHSAWYSEQSVEEVKRISASEIARVLSGQKPLYPVNNPIFPGGNLNA